MRKRGVWAIALLVGCSSGGNGGYVGNGGGVGGSGLSGTWIFQGTQGSSMSSGTIVLSPTELTISANGGKFKLQREGGSLSIVYSDARTHESASGTQSGSGRMTFGVFPIDVSGTASIAETATDASRTAGTCTTMLSTGSLAASCVNVGSPPRPIPRLRGNVSAARISEESSIFGDLGGVWMGSSSEGTTCTVTIQSSTVSVTCSGDSELDGSLSMTFASNMVSGSTSRGIEFAAMR